MSDDWAASPDANTTLHLRKKLYATIFAGARLAVAIGDRVVHHGRLGESLMLGSQAR